MKKLITTLFAAAAAFGLRADAQGPISGTSFEEQPVGIYDITNGTGELARLVDPGDTYWVTNETSTLTIVEGRSATGTFPNGIPRRPDAFASGVTQQRYLKVQTTLGNAVTRRAKTDGSGTSIGSGGIYFDSLVKFTAFDSIPATTLGDDGKLAIWLKEELDANDTPIATNIYISAGFLVNTMHGAVPTNYLCEVEGVNLADGGWHRVTVKAIESIYKTEEVPGFMVFVDTQYVRRKNNDGTGIDSEKLTETAKAYNGVRALFPSAVQYGGEKLKIASVAFDGQGEVDDLVFTTKAPSFAADSEYFTIDLDTNIASVTYNAGEGDTTIYGSTLINYTPGMSVSIVDIQGKVGYMAGEVTFGSGVETNWVGDVVWYEPTDADQSITVNAKASGAYIVGGDKYETLAEAFDAVSGMSGSQEIKMTGHSDGGIRLETATLSEVTLDLMGFSITGAVGNAAIYASNDGEGSLLLNITNSTVEVGRVVAGENGSALMSVYADVAIGGGIFDGLVNVMGAESYKISDGAFLCSANNELTLDAAVKSALGDEYGIVEDGDYFVVGSAGATKYLVEFYDGYMPVASTNIEENTTLVCPDDPESRAGYTFVGWLTDPADLDSAWDFDDVVTEDMTLYAGWRLDSYMITFEVGEYDAVDPASTNFTIETDTIILPTATTERVGVDFAGWTNSVITDAIFEFTPTAENLESFTLYAKWDSDVPPPPEKHDAGAEIICGSAEAATTLAGAITANPVAYVNVPEGVANGAAYCAFFKGVADGTSVTIVLTEAATATVQTAVDAAMEAVPLQALASGSEDQQYVRVTAIPGLYYSVSVGSSCTSLAEVTPRTLAQDTGAGANIDVDGKIAIPVSRPALLGATAGFYKVNANIEPAPQD